MSTTEPDIRKRMTLREAAGIFFRQPGPRLILATVLVVAALRVAVGGISFWDPALLGLVVLVWAFQEWFAHKYILHLKPRTVLGLRLDPHFAREHRAHHRAPWKLKETLLPISVIAGAIPVAAFLWWLVTPSLQLALTGMAAYSLMALAYEWTHYLTHTGYVPKSRYFDHVVKAHRLHHFKDEQNWLGFTMPFIDVLLGTSPDPARVPTSPTCRTLGVDEDR